MTWTYIAPTLVAVTGLAVGNYIDLLANCLPRELPVSSLDSPCQRCGFLAIWLNKLPVLRYTTIGLRCSACRGKALLFFPYVELLTASVFLLTLLKQRPPSDFNGWAFAADLAFSSAVITLIFINLEHLLLPNAITYPGIAMCLVARLLLPGLGEPPPFYEWLAATWPAWSASLADGVIGMLAGGGSLLALRGIWRRLRGVEALGLGDVKMMLMIGAYLGAIRTCLTLGLVVVLALPLAVVVYIVLVKRRAAGAPLLMPSGFLWGIPAIIVVLVGQKLTSWLSALTG